MFVVDANVLAIAADRTDPGHEACRLQLDAWRAQAGPWYLTWPIVFEFLTLTTHPSIYRQPWTVEAAWAYVEAILAAPSLSMIAAGERHQEILDRLLVDPPRAAGAPPTRLILAGFGLDVKGTAHEGRVRLARAYALRAPDAAALALYGAKEGPRVLLEYEVG